MRPWALYYRNDSNGDNGGDDNTKDVKVDQAAALTIPVLGPLPNQGPLLLGAEMTLNPPTPFQWQTINHAVEQHAKYLNQQHKRDLHNEGNIDAAPLVAIMDSVTSSSAKSQYGVGRYATIAAVVGMSTTSQDVDQRKQGLDTTDSSSLRESLDRIVRDDVAPWESKIRLVGVGRALLSDFFHRMALQDYNVDGDGYLIKMQKSAVLSQTRLQYSKKNDDNDMDNMHDDDEHDDDEHDDIDDDRMNLVMAKFFVVTDGVDRTLDFQRRGRDTRRGWKRSAAASPVHHITELASWARKLDYLHQDRRRLVAGLQAAAARLELAQQATNNLEGEFDDYDGLGMITATRYGGDEEFDASQSAVEDILQFPPSAETQKSATTLVNKENYGMGYSSASFSTLPQVTDVWLEKLAPYYSPGLRESEEYYYEILSFVAVISMDKFLRDVDFGWALTCYNTLERMQQVYDWMWQHVRLLEAEASLASARLRDCGEECTDLW